MGVACWCGLSLADEAALDAHLMETGHRPYAVAEEGRKDDAGKLRWGLLPFAALREVVGVLTYGARKYAPENWRKVPDARQRYFDAALRHLAAWRTGELVDAESKINHLAHAACCILFMLELDPQPEEKPSK